MLDTPQITKINNNLELFLKRESSTIAIATVYVAPSLVNKIKKHTLDIYKNKVKTKGFVDGVMSESYAEKNCTYGISESCNQFILDFFVKDFLDEKIKNQKIVILSPPKLLKIEQTNSCGLNFIFKLSIISTICPDSWEKINFSPPKRKLYKDLDRQAVTFIKNTLSEEKTITGQDNLVEDADWIAFDIMLLNNNNQPAIRNYKCRFWLKIDVKYITTPLHNLFLGKAKKESFIISDISILGPQADLLSSKGKFRAEICEIVKANKFSLEKFKSIFHLTDEKSMHEKLIEIFSFRNDISQRRLIIDEAFRVIFNKIRFEVPRYLILRRQEKLLEGIKKLPDYNVYKSNENFNKQVSLLAEKQIKEEALVQQIGFNDNIDVDQKDIVEYLNLLNHNRLVEFVYFLPNINYLNDICLPIRDAILKAAILKEKILNFVIKKLSTQ